VYPASVLAEAAGLLESRGIPYRAGDCVLQPLRGPAKIFGRLPELSGGFPVVAKVAAATLDHDRAWLARHFAGWNAPFVIAGTGLVAIGDRLVAQIPRVMISEDPTGYSAALRLLNENPDPGPPDSWPFASWDRLPLGRRGRLSMWHGRGCTHHCTYCPYVIATGRRQLLRSAARTLEEFRWQARRHRPRRVVFRDPVFGLDRASALDLLDRLASLPRREQVPFEIESRPEVLDPEMLGALARAGCVEVKMGVESVEEKALVAVRRVHDRQAATHYVARAAEAVERGRELRLTIRVYLLQGLDGSTAGGDEESAARFSHAGPVTIRQVLPPDAAARADMMSARR
jgi:hypothetical protein